MIKRILQNTAIKGLPYGQRIPKIASINKGFDNVNKLNITDSDIFSAQSIYYLAQILSGSETDFSALTKRVSSAESNIDKEKTDRIAADVALDNTIDFEMQRAQTAEATNATNIETNKTDINNLTNRVSTNEDNIANEVTRATAIESTKLDLSTGNTESRPTGKIAGYVYFDTTLNKPIWYTGTSWVDATGTAI